jgi:dTDP-4-dehydrorhamnose 3,5-epimerase
MSDLTPRFTITETAIPEVKIIQPRIHGDERGFFMETYRENEFKEGGIPGQFVQDNHSRSSKGVLRGLHFQVAPHRIGKLVRVVRGSAYDVAVDLRSDSATYGQWVGEILTVQNQKMFFIPEGFAHAFLALEDETEFLYKMSGYYAPEYEKGLSWNDPDIAIVWPDMDQDFLVSEKDQSNLSFKDIQASPVF